MASVRIRRLGDLSQRGVWLCIECHGCRRRVLYDPKDIIDYLGSDRALEALKISPCSKCGSTFRSLAAHEPIDPVSRRKLKPKPIWTDRT